MFIVNLIYKKPIEFIETHTAAHRAFLDECYKKNFFVASGPKIPRTGGIIISHLKNRAQLEEILKQDPFALHHLADYEITEFNPVKHHPDFSGFVQQHTS